MSGNGPSQSWPSGVRSRRWRPAETVQGDPRAAARPDRGAAGRRRHAAPPDARAAHADRLVATHRPSAGRGTRPRLPWSARGHHPADRGLHARRGRRVPRVRRRPRADPERAARGPHRLRARPVPLGAGGADRPHPRQRRAAPAQRPRRPAVVPGRRAPVRPRHHHRCRLPRGCRQLGGRRLQRVGSRRQTAVLGRPRRRHRRGRRAPKAVEAPPAPAAVEAAPLAPPQVVPLVASPSVVDEDSQPTDARAASRRTETPEPAAPGSDRPLFTVAPAPGSQAGAEAPAPAPRPGRCCSSSTRVSACSSPPRGREPRARPRRQRPRRPPHRRHRPRRVGLEDPSAHRALPRPHLGHRLRFHERLRRPQRRRPDDRAGRGRARAPRRRRPCPHGQPQLHHQPSAGHRQQRRERA